MIEQRSLFSTPAVPTRTDGRIGVLTWNVQHAAPKRAWQQVEWLAAQPDTDIIALTEVGGLRSAAVVGEALRYYGYATHVPVGEVTDYRVVVASRVGKLRIVAAGPDCMPHRGVVGRVAFDQETITIAAVYVPSRGPQERRNVAKRAFQDAVARMLPDLVSRFGSQGPVLIGGDLNVVEPQHSPHHSVFGEWEYNFYRSFEKAGLVDCFRHLHREAEDHSWYGRSGLGFRFDHIFIDDASAGRVLACRYEHGTRIGGLSDHSAMVLTLTVASHN